MKKSELQEASAMGQKVRELDRRTFLKQTGKLLAGGGAVAALPGEMKAAMVESVSGPEAGSTIISTTEHAPWQKSSPRAPGWIWNALDVQVRMESSQPEIEGFGGCFNELGWTSLQMLGESDRNAILAELFSPGKGANFRMCRMPIGANDFSRGWYSYNETPDDFGMEHFSTANDLETLVPFIKSAKQYNPALRVWASPWSPPTWMKTNKHYAESQSMPPMPANGLRADQVRKEGEDVFIHEERYYEAYARYFGKFIDSYKQQGIEVSMVMPQNEFNSAQNFPSCTWTPEGLGRFLRHLGPEMDRRKVEIFFGTYERGNAGLLDRAMADAKARQWIKGVGMQWAGKNAIRAIHAKYPELRIYQSEQECGDGKNEWSYAGYCWNLMKHYLLNGTCGYLYWNLSLQEGGRSQWGWPQNSLVTVNPETRKYTFNHEYYLLKHVSHFVQPGARRLETDGTFDDVLVFRNPDKSVAVILRNESPRGSSVDVTIGGSKTLLNLPADSFNTLLVKPDTV